MARPRVPREGELEDALLTLCSLGVAQHDDDAVASQEHLAATGRGRECGTDWLAGLAGWLADHAIEHTQRTHRTPQTFSRGQGAAGSGWGRPDCSDSAICDSTHSGAPDEPVLVHGDTGEI